MVEGRQITISARELNDEQIESILPGYKNIYIYKLRVWEIILKYIIEQIILQ